MKAVKHIQLCNPGSAQLVELFLFFFQHYTKDADGLCTRLIKPKLEEGTVAAQDEFSRSERRFDCALCSRPVYMHITQTCRLSSELPTGGWSMNRKDVKLHQVIGKGEFGGKSSISRVFCHGGACLLRGIQGCSSILILLSN